MSFFIFIQYLYVDRKIGLPKNVLFETNVSMREVAAREREGRDTPKSEGRREEDEKKFGPMGREGKKVFGKGSSQVR